MPFGGDFLVAFLLSACGAFLVGFVTAFGTGGSFCFDFLEGVFVRLASRFDGFDALFPAGFAGTGLLAAFFGGSFFGDLPGGPIMSRRLCQSSRGHGTAHGAYMAIEFIGGAARDLQVHPAPPGMS